MINYHRLKQPLRHAQWANINDPDFDPNQVAQNLCMVFSIQDSLFISLISQFIDKIRGTSQGLQPHQVEDYNAACKLRYSELYKLCTNILEKSIYEDIELSRADGKPFVRVSSEVEIRFTDGSIFDLTLNGHPKVYGYLSKAIVQAIICLAREGFHASDYSKVLIPYLQVILSVGQIFDDLRGGDQVIKKLERDAFQSLMGISDPLVRIPELMSQLENDIQLGRRAPKYIRDIALAVQLVDLSPFSADDYHVSLRSTGTSISNIPLNGLSASIVETDVPSDCDPLIGYKSYYRKTPFPNVNQYNRKTVTIEQHKLKRRVIHMASNPIQDRCNWFHRRMIKILRRISSDCTFNQDAGRQFARRMTAIASNEERNIYSCDISSATDTISREFQERVLAIFFGPDLAQSWTKVTGGTGTFCFKDGRNISFTPARGQPQGYKSSFPAFALAHHILMRLVMLDCRLTDVNPNDFYRVLGDDSIVSYPDPGLLIRDSYENLSHEIGWKINRSKGYYFYSDSDILAVAEFAKVRYCNGTSLSPLPLMLMLGLNSLNGLVPASLFIAKHLCRTRSTDLVPILDQALVPMSVSYYILLLIKYRVGIWSNIEDNSSISELTDEQLSLLYIYYFRTQLERTMLSMWLPSEWEKSPLDGWTEAKKRSLTFLEYLKLADESADLDSNHKIWILMAKQDRLIQLMSQAFEDATLSYAGLGIDLSPEDQTLLERSCEVLVDYKLTEPSEVLELIPKAIKLLSRFSPRSDSLNSAHESELISRYSMQCIEDLGIPDEVIVRAFYDTRNQSLVSSFDLLSEFSAEDLDDYGSDDSDPLGDLIEPS